MVNRGEKAFLGREIASFRNLDREAQRSEDRARIGNDIVRKRLRSAGQLCSETTNRLV